MLGTGKRVAFWRGIYIGQRNGGAAIGQHTYRFNQGGVSMKAGALAHLRPGERAAVTEYITHIRQRFPGQVPRIGNLITSSKNAGEILA